MPGGGSQWHRTFLGWPAYPVPFGYRQNGSVVGVLTGGAGMKTVVVRDGVVFSEHSVQAQWALTADW